MKGDWTAKFPNLNLAELLRIMLISRDLNVRALDLKKVKISLLLTGKRPLDGKSRTTPMSNQTIEAKIATFGALLSENFVFKAPIFQRPYVWPKSKVTKLLEDIHESGDDAQDGHFVGAMFVSRKVSASPMAPGEYWVIDGQQRMTTIFVAALALHVLIDDRQRELKKIKEPDEETKAHIQKLDGLAFNLRKHLFIEPRPREYELKFTSTLKDLPQLSALISKINEKRPDGDKLALNLPVPPAGSADKKTEITDAFLAAKSALGHYLGDEFHADEVTKLVTKILGHTKVVFITLTDNDDACEVFDTLNSTQERLKVVDLVRNEVFLRVRDDANYVKAQRIYDFNWKPFDQLFDGQKHLDDYFFPYALTKNSSVKKSKLTRFLAEKWDEGTPLSSEEIIKDLSDWAPVYLALSSESQTNIVRLKERVHSKVYSALWRLRRMNCPASVYPYLMQIGKDCIDNQDARKADSFAKCADIIESFLVRRFLCGHEPTGLHAVFKDMWAKAKNDPDKLLSEILSVTTIAFPDDGAVTLGINTRNMYKGSLTAYVLMEYERSLAEPTMPYADEYDERRDPDEKMHIDHIMPQSADEQWRAAFPEYEKFIHRLGNLVIMQETANERKSNMSWIETKRFLGAGTRVMSVNQLVKLERWDQSEMQRRTDNLCKWALNRWKR
ncbi:MAG: DUF262 domain-containing HNH endonuclease family protein [Leptolyngbyaceae bacterium]|nr:DUF262 domain-containing HNH endonuclease family protein [Leptolyngbyaceae bacterium]